MRNRRTNATRSTTETLLYAVGMDGHGRESVTVMSHSICSASSVMRKESLWRPRRYIIRNLCRKEELMMRVTSLLYVKCATQGFMHRVETDGIAIDPAGAV